MEQKRSIIGRLAVGADALLFIILIVLMIAEAYTRYTVNQNFTFLGSWSLPALMFTFVALTLGILYRDLLA